MLNRFVGLNLCQTQNWSERPWRSSCHTPLGPSTDTAGTTVNTNARKSRMTLKRCYHGRQTKPNMHVISAYCYR